MAAEVGGLLSSSVCAQPLMFRSQLPLGDVEMESSDLSDSKGLVRRVVITRLKCDNAARECWELEL